MFRRSHSAHYNFFLGFDLEVSLIDDDASRKSEGHSGAGCGNDVFFSLLNGNLVGRCGE